MRPAAAPQSISRSPPYPDHLPQGGMGQHRTARCERDGDPGAGIARGAPCLSQRRRRNRRIERRRSGAASRRDRRVGRPVRRRKVDTAACRRAARTAGRRECADIRRRVRRSAGRAADFAAPLRIGFCVSVSPSAGGVFGARKRHAAADDRRRQPRPSARKSRCIVGRCRARGARRAIGRPGCRAASSSGLRLSGRSPTIQRSCSATSRQVISTTPPGRGS